MYLFFDTETTGLPRSWKAPITDSNNWPRLVQIAWLVFDLDKNWVDTLNRLYLSYYVLVNKKKRLCIKVI